MQIFLCISNQNSKISKIPRTFINLFLILFVTKIDEYKWDKEKFQREIFINMRFSINSSQIFFHRSTKRSLSVSFLLFKIFQKKNWQKRFLTEIASMGGQKGVEPCHTSKSRGQFPSRVEHDYWQQWRESAFRSIVAREPFQPFSMGSSVP